MKKNICILAGLMTISWLFCTVKAQENNPPIPAPSIPDISYDKEPTVIKRVDPIYPESMLRGGGEATVYMKAFIGVDGSVIEAKIEKIQVSTDNIIIDNKNNLTKQKTDGKAFEEASYNAVKQWIFSPAQIQGKPVAVWVTIPFRFKLSTVKETTPKDKANRAETEKRIESIKTVIENILKGKEAETAKKFIDINASLIYNTKIVNLYSVLNGEYKDMNLAEGKETRCVNFNVNITDGGNSALIVWTSELPKEKNKRIHSIVISKSASNEWKIKHWHVSF